MPEPARGSSRSRPAMAEASALPTVEEFLRVLGRSGLLDRQHLTEVLSAIPAPIRGSARDLADRLITLGELTHYQTEKLLKGRFQGLVLGPYRILAPLGRGGMGTVYLASAPTLPFSPSPAPSSLVALKVLPPKRARDEAKTLARFRREMELGLHLAHPNITRTLEAGEVDGIHFIAMEYVPGPSLRQLVGRSGPMPAADAARVFVDVAAGLVHAHERGLIHRDLKPSNIVVTPDGRAKILDLGLALLMDEALPEDPSIVGGEGYILGTMDYIAPEQTSDATNVGPHSDIYALGCSIYYAVTGVPPFPGGTAHQKMKWHRTETAPAANLLNPAVPLGFARIVEHLMAKRPEDRPASAEAVRAILAPWVGESVAAVAAIAAPHSDREVVAEIDTRAFDPSLWDAIPMAELVETIPDERSRPTPIEESAPPDVRLMLVVAGGIALVLGLTVVLLSLLRRL